MIKNRKDYGNKNLKIVLKNIKNDYEKELKVTKIKIKMTIKNNGKENNNK